MNPRKRRQRSSLVFAWEARSASALTRAGRLATPLVLLSALGVFAGFLWRVERDRAEERQRLADEWYVHTLVDKYRANHDGGCPSTLKQVAVEEGVRGLSLDGGGLALENYCPTELQTVSFSAYERGFAPTRAHGPLE